MEVGDGFPSVMLVRVVFPLNKVVRFVCFKMELLSITASSRIVSTS